MSSLDGSWLATNSQLLIKVKVKVTLQPTVSRPVCLGARPHLGLKIRFLLLSDSCRFVDVGRPLWREDWSVVHNFCWLRQRSHFRVRVPRDLRPYFTCLRFEAPPTWRARFPYLYPPGTGWTNSSIAVCLFSAYHCLVTDVHYITLFYLRLSVNFFSASQQIVG
jgi:hypothetical protein